MCVSNRGMSVRIVELADDHGPAVLDIYRADLSRRAGADPVRRGTSGAGSTGLGLDIARQRAEASGGALTVHSGPGGAAVDLELGPPREP